MKVIKDELIDTDVTFSTDGLYDWKPSEELDEIITAVPSWILRRGIILIFFILSGLILLSAFIRYPEVVKVSLKINSLNAPKSILAKQSGKLTTLLVQDGEMVRKDQPLAYFESTARPRDVITLNEHLKIFQSKISKKDLLDTKLPDELKLGEIQGSFQIFYQQYLQYLSTQKDGYYLNRMAFLEKDLKDIMAMKGQILTQRKIQNQEYNNQQEEYKAYQKLYKNKVISRSEFASQENKYLSAKYPLQQTETSLLNNAGTYSIKEKELLDLRHTISDEQAKFVQALNQCITESDAWIMLYVLKAPIDGKLNYSGIVQQNQNFASNQEVFIVNPGNTDFFGEAHIPQYNMGKIKKGEKTLIKLHSYPYEQYGILKGKLSYISDVAFKDSVFIAKVSFEKLESGNNNREIILKNGMLADAEIITEESSLLRRFYRNIIKILAN
jgi:multidrug efflux pump subunit AcrA (membrane-fusion protein)